MRKILIIALTLLSLSMTAQNSSDHNFKVAKKP